MKAITAGAVRVVLDALEARRMTGITKMAISSTELRRKMGFYKQLAEFHPIEITRVGKPSTILMSATEYFRLAARDEQASTPSIGKPGNSPDA
jgi:PHD/YefM family antitoxin component YafN of YafNO toxin-antitoxin module